MDETKALKPRPIFARYLIRRHCLSMPMDLPTNEEIQDAMRVLEECDPPVYDVDSLLLEEAHTTLSESSGSFTRHERT